MNQLRIQEAKKTAEFVLGNKEGSPFEELMLLFELQYPEISFAFATCIVDLARSGNSPRPTLPKEIEAAMRLVTIYSYQTSSVDVVPFAWLRSREQFLARVACQVIALLEETKESEQTARRAAKYVVDFAEGMKGVLPDRRLAESCGAHALLLALQHNSPSSVRTHSRVLKCGTATPTHSVLMEEVAERIVSGSCDATNWKSNAYGFVFGSDDVRAFMNACRECGRSAGRSVVCLNVLLASLGDVRGNAVKAHAKNRAERYRLRNATSKQWTTACRLYDAGRLAASGSRPRQAATLCSPGPPSRKRTHSAANANAVDGTSLTWRINGGGRSSSSSASNYEVQTAKVISDSWIEANRMLEWLRSQERAKN